MTVTTQSSADNGVNVEAIREARDGHGRPARRGPVPVARPVPVDQRHPLPHDRSRTTSGPAPSSRTGRRSPSTPTTPSCSPPRTTAPPRSRLVLVGLAGCLTGGIASVAANRGIQLRSVTATLTGEMDLQGVLGIDSDVRNGFSAMQVRYEIDADAPEEQIEAVVAQSQKRSAVFDAADQPDERRRRGRLTGLGPSNRSESHAHHHGHHRRRRPGRPGDEPLPVRPVDRPRAARTRRGGELVAHGALGFASAAHPQLAVPAARLVVPGQRPTRLHVCRRGGRHTSTATAAISGRPCRPQTTVQSVRSDRDGFVVTTDRGQWRSRAVVVASGAASTRRIPAISRELPAAISQLAPIRYRNPSQVGARVLVVGASASGVQIADELARSGRGSPLPSATTSGCPAATAAGTSIGGSTPSANSTSATTRSRTSTGPADCRRCSSSDHPQRRTLDLAHVGAQGVELVGRLVGVTASHAAVLRVARAPVRCGRPQAGPPAGPDRRVRRHAPGSTASIRRTARRPLRSARPDRAGHRRLRHRRVGDRLPTALPVAGRPLLDRKGRFVHDGGVLIQPGMYVLGLPFTRRRKSSFLDGVGPDAPSSPST